jgi:hypothetical protein
LNLENWKIGLPVFGHEAVLDNSTVSEYTRCPRKGLYRYGMRRGFEGKSYSIQYGIAYHKYRELVEKEMIKLNCKMTQAIHEAAISRALEGFEEPPMDHKHCHLNRIRLSRACLAAKERIEEEQRTGKVIVTRSEDSFDLELPFYFCPNCGWTAFVDDIEDEGR